ncbi:MAG: hypothetical protein ACOY3V_01855 [Pseudomonadota bacterium]
MLDQVKLDEHPALADFGAGNFACARLLLQRDRMNLEQVGGLLQSEGVHGAIFVQSNEPD